jgi:hypothetical protein
MLSMIIDDLNLRRSVAGPDKTNPLLTVDSNTMLAGAITGQRFEMIPWWQAQKIQCRRAVEQLKFALGDGAELGKFHHRFSSEKFLGIPGIEGLNRHLPHRLLV